MNKLVKKIAMVLAMAGLVAAVTGCGGSPAPQSKAPERPKAVSITYVKAPLNIPSIVEKQQKLFEQEFGKAGMGVNLPEITVGPKQTEAMAAGSVDFAHCLGGSSAILAAANGVDLKIIGIYSRAPKAFVVMVKADSIRSIADLKGKKVAGPKGTILHQLLLAGLAREGLKASDVQFVSMDLPAAMAALMNGSVDVALSAGADALRAQQSGARVIATGEGLVDATIVTAVRGEFLKQYPELVKQFVGIHRAAVEKVKREPETAYQLTAAETGLTLDMVKSMAPLYDFDFTIRPKDIEELKLTQEFLKQNGMLDKTVDIEKLLVKID